MENIRKCKYP